MSEANPTTPRVSSITACYRMGKYLRTFLEQLPLQTYFNQLEVVLDHNDPSPEELEWVRAFQQKYPGRLKHIITTPVVPIGTSMNTCIRESRGEFLAIWNVDDLRTPNSIESQVQALDENPNAGICYGNFTIVRSFTATKGKYVRCDHYPQSERTRSMFAGPYFMFRKSLCEKAGLFDEQLKQGADYDLAMRLGFHTLTVMAKADLGYYLNEGLGASNRPGTLLPYERTAIELRYGIYDKIDYRYAAQASTYDIPMIHYGNERIPVASFVPDYDNELKRRFTLWHEKGIRAFCFQTLIRYSGLKTVVRRLKRLGSSPT